MKRIFLFSVVITALSLAACKDDPPSYNWDPQLMHVDGVNANAPFIPPGTVELAAQFGKDAMDFYAGKKIDAVQVFIFEVPTICDLVFYGKGDGNTPGAQIYSQTIDDALDADSWNIIELDQPLSFPTDELWISVRLEDAAGMQVVGCDSGPAIDGGDWMYQSSDNDWLTFRERSTDNINWNIRASVID